MDDRISDELLKKLVRNKKNNKLRRIIQRTEVSDLVDSSGRNLLHLAAKYGNLELIEFLLPTEGLIDAKTVFGDTPLMISLMNDQFEAAKLLLNGNANISLENADNKTAFQIALQQKTPADVVNMFITELIKNDMTVPQIAKIMDDAKFSLKRVLSLQDTRFTKAVLELQKSINRQESYDLVLETMKVPTRPNVENLITLMRCGPAYKSRKLFFWEGLASELETCFIQVNAEYLVTVVETLWRLDGIDLDFYFYFAEVFHHGSKSAIKILLRSRIDEHVRQKYGRDYLVLLFGNPRVNAIKLTRDRPFDFDGRAIGEKTAMHFAVRSDMPENLQYLLDKGANPNLTDSFHMTPLFYTREVKILKILLQSGADVQVKDAVNFTVFDIIANSRIPDLLELLLAHLALIVAKDTPIVEDLRKKIDRRRRWKRMYENFQSQITWMKDRRINRYLSLFDVLKRDPGSIVCYVWNVNNPRRAIAQWLDGYPLHGYYRSTLKKCLKKAIKLHHLRSIVASIIDESSSMFSEEDLVVANILSFLNYDDLKHLE